MLLGGEKDTRSNFVDSAVQSRFSPLFQEVGRGGNTGELPAICRPSLRLHVPTHTHTHTGEKEGTVCDRCPVLFRLCVSALPLADIRNCDGIEPHTGPVSIASLLLTRSQVAADRVSSRTLASFACVSRRRCYWSTRLCLWGI